MQVESLMHHNATATNTAVAVSAVPSRLHGLSISNPNTVSVWIQFFDLAAGDVSVGTTTRKQSYMIPAGTSAADQAGKDFAFEFAPKFLTAMSYAITTTPTGSAAPSTAIPVNILYS